MTGYNHRAEQPEPHLFVVTEEDVPNEHSHESTRCPIAVFIDQAKAGDYRDTLEANGSPYIQYSLFQVPLKDGLHSEE